ncbi:MAG TPA: RIP metalloprotease RseP [Rhodanobacteraceae bacterium]|nr:RIP metalloprotease RseP [Rhodanobacteraceae bacterium]
MSEFFGSVWWLIVTLGLLVTFHEFGHFWVARRCGVKVLRFSVGFGRALWKRSGRDGTEYWIAMIPLGGYVKFLDAREGEVEPGEAAQEFTGKPVWQRIAIVAAGPAFNLIFAVAAFWLMFSVGKPDFAPILGQPSGIAAGAGVAAGDRILAIDGTPVATWTGALDALTDDLLLRNPATLTLRNAAGQQRDVTLPLQQLPADTGMEQAFGQLGLKLSPPAAIAAKVMADSPAAQAGLRDGDRILAINGEKIANFAEIGPIIGKHAAKSPALDFTILRDGQRLGVTVTAAWRHPDAGPARWIIGIAPPDTERATLRYGPLHALGAAFATTWDKAATTFRMIGGMLTGQASTKNLSGVITIAQVANTSAHMGLAWFLEFLGLISLSLAVLNLLPIPLLDGGHLLYYLIEIIKGSPVSERTMIAGQYLGMALLAALMGLAFYNDILRLVS